MSLNLPQLRPNALLSPVPKPHIHRPSSPQPTNSLKLLLFHRHLHTSNPTETSALPHPAHLWKKHHRPSLRCRATEEQLVTGRGAGGSTMDKIVEKLKKFGYVDGHDDDSAAGSAGEKGSIQDVFYAENGEAPPRPRGGLLLSGPGEKVRFPWEMDGEHEGVDDRRGGARLARRRSSHSSLAELTLPEGELRRLRLLAVRAKSRIKIGGTGVTEEVVDKIHEKWKTEEIVRLKCEGPPALNMKRMHEILERKTGGLVIWRSGSSLSMYRGVSYEVQPVKRQRSYGPRANSFDEVGVSTVENSLQTGARDTLDMIPQESLSSRKTEEAVTSMQLKYDHEIDMLLDELGPRFTDWPGSGPLPVDADLLPGCISGYNPPFRLLPYGVRRSLGMKDQTALRRLARVLPPHFAIGRSRQLQGLAASMVKLWQKSSIAKISFKRGVQLTTSERMAEELKKLTGGTLLFRNNDHMVFYRGQDFLSFEITEKLMERERLAKVLQDEEEQARLKASSSLSSNIDIDEEQRIAGTLGETLEADSRWGRQLDDNFKNIMSRAAEVERHVRLVKKLERKLSVAEFKLSKAERALGKVEEFLKPAAQQSDPESITEEERFMFRKLGLKMKAFLLLGRRGVFDGTVENMHLHWKYRELVKIIVKAKTFAQVRNVALALEAESGGVLVSVDKVSKGFAVVVYRGRDYTRPPTIRPKNLLTKRKALARSIELQRQEDLKRHISNLRRRVGKLMSELSQMEAAKEHGDEELYAKLDSQYLSDEEEDSEDEDAYLDTFDGDLNLYCDEESGSSTKDNTHDEDGTYKDNSDDMGQVQDEEAYLDTFDSDLNLPSDEEAGSSSKDNTHDQDGTYEDNSDDMGQG